MAIKKKHYTNYIILENGALIQKISLKFWFYLELEKDNYNPNYTQRIQGKAQGNLSRHSEVFRFFSKYQTLPKP